MATAQLTAFSISVSARNLSSFEGLRASNVKFASFKPAGGFALSQRPFRCLVVKAATVVAPKVKINSLYQPIAFVFPFKVLNVCLVCCVV
jgi:hypothetical protein